MVCLDSKDSVDEYCILCYSDSDLMIWAALELNITMWANAVFLEFTASYHEMKRIFDPTEILLIGCSNYGLKA